MNMRLTICAAVSFIYQIIPAEIMVAAFQDSSTALYATASTASDARIYLEASGKGTDGIVFQTDDISEVLALKVRILWFSEHAINCFYTMIITV